MGSAEGILKILDTEFGTISQELMTMVCPKEHFGVGLWSTVRSLLGSFTLLYYGDTPQSISTRRRQVGFTGEAKLICARDEEIVRSKELFAT